jgi:Na+-transporting NADH:ubiquinone oxidoreductase subunit F
MGFLTAGFLTTVVTAGASIGAISAVLGALISVTDRVVNNYGEVTITINSGKKDLEVKGGANMLTTLSEQEIFLPSACGGRGSCGACKVEVTSDVGPHLPTELPYLDKDEVDRNVRLACQIKVKTDVQIQIPEELFNIRRVTGTVEKLTSVTHDIKEVLVRLPDDMEWIPYLPGQYGQLEVPPYDKVKERTQRAYSFSSNPSDAKHVEFLIRLVPGGIVTTYVHEHMKEGQKINVLMPMGDFHVRQTDAQMICVAGGSGMAPFKSIFNAMVEDGTIETREVWYFFGARSVRDLFYVDWLNELDNKYEKFHFVAALSEPAPDDNWEGETGLITEVLDRYIKEVIPQGEKEGYLCGSPGMLDACMAVMGQNNMNPERIFFDKFA